MTNLQKQCSFCRATISINNAVIRCISCGTVLHYACAKNIGNDTCPVCQVSLEVKPSNVEIVVAGNNAEEVRYVALSLFNQAQIDRKDISTTSLNISGNVTESNIIIGNSNGIQSQPKVNSPSNYAKIEKLMPALLGEMRKDLRENPTTREFVILKRGWVYNSRGPYLAYYLDEHEDLEGKLQVLGNLGLIKEITYNNVRRFLFQEELVDYLTGT